jgi:hypothetical protein
MIQPAAINAAWFRGAPLDVMNDTGSSILSLTKGQARQRGINVDFPEGTLNVLTANGIVSRERHLVRVQICGPGQSLLGHSFLEHAIIVPDGTPNLLSGSRMRDKFCFASSKGNQWLAIGTSKEATFEALHSD